MDMSIYLNIYNDHCLKVLGLLPLKIDLYLLWLALGTVLVIGNLRLLYLNRLDLLLLMSSLFRNTAVLIIEIVSLEAL